ncbi:peptidase [Pseudoduganella sp. SL102]|uniref:peptidase n=1 Tax=Pseudoduganella sp. SL102 TaxID=2995154 RepID=UPI00248AB245|nr:peptidase [Pseudoduganella sp. SL102]WBS00202.1 peptidase [Pseudoduganella sp. SL102]
MTYCVAMRLDAGLVFLSDSRTNAGVDQIGTFRKMNVFENPGDRTMVLMTAGNLSISQSVLQLLHDHVGLNGFTIWTAPNMYEATRIVGEAVRAIHQREAQALAQFNIEFNVSIIFGGQIRGEACRLFQVYSAGNFIEARDENTYFQIGEAKYGKPIIDRVVTPRSSLDDAVKCALISMDSTLRSNISVGLPLDLLAYQADSLAVTRFVTIDEKNAYFQMLRGTWGEQLRRVFEGIDAPQWQAMPGADDQPVRMPLPEAVAPVAAPPMLQSLAQQAVDSRQ